MPAGRALARPSTNVAPGNVRPVSIGALALAMTLLDGCRGGGTATAVRAVPTPLPSGPVFDGAPPARIVVSASPLGISPDGVIRALVRVAFRDARGNATTLLGGGDVDIRATSPAAHVQWQTRMRFGGPAAIVSFDHPGATNVDVRASVGTPLRPMHVRLDASRGTGPRVTAAALGAHVVQVGWIGDGTNENVRVLRDAGRGLRFLGIVAAPATTFRDASVAPNARYRYAVLLGGRMYATPALVTPPLPAGAPRARLRGKGMWLSFSPSPLDANAYTRLDPAAIVARARASGIRTIELRVAYGPFWEITPDARPAVDALLDDAARAGIAVEAWTVPRSTAFDDLAASARATQYRTAAGIRFAALAVDLERGGDFLGDGAAGYAALTDYLRRLREALGPRYPLIATVEDPFLEHLTSRDYPYAAIAASADVVQPMAYWRMMSAKNVTPAAVRAALRGSFAAVRREAGRDVRIDLGGQTSGDAHGAPSSAEVKAAVREARALGAEGITFFDWDGTSAPQWRALAESRW